MGTGVLRLKKTLAVISFILTSTASFAFGPSDLYATIQATDTLGLSRTIINSNDWLLADAIDGVTGANQIGLSSNQTWTGNNVYSSTTTLNQVTITNLTWSGLDNYFHVASNNTANASTTNTFDAAIVTNVDVLTSWYLLESAAAPADKAGYGQFWVSNATPNEVYFVADDGTETKIGSGGGGGGGGTIQDANLTIVATDTGTVAYTTAKGLNSVDLQTERAVGGAAATAQMNQGDNCSLLGGENNRIIAAVTHSTIAGGRNNEFSVASGNFGFIGGGDNNGIDTAADYCVIGGGGGNSINASVCTYSTIGGGANNVIGGTAGSYNAILGGTACEVSKGTGCVIGGGNNNEHSASGSYGFIGTGSGNDITVTGGSSFIGTGLNNESQGPYSFIGTGSGILIGDNSSQYNSILNGVNNSIDPNDAQYCTILGGNGCDMDPIGAITYCLAFGDNVDVTDTSAQHNHGFGEDITLAHDGVTVFNDGNGAGTTTTVDSQFTLDFANGFKMVKSHVIKTVAAGQTASVGSAQGGLPITTDIIEISTVGTIGDSTTLPTAQAGLVIRIINNGANACDVFPATGDDLGAGVNTAVSLASGANITYVAYDATNWETM